MVLMLAGVGTAAEGAVAFDGEHDMFRLSNKSIKELSGITVAVWVKPDRPGNILRGKPVGLNYDYNNAGFSLTGSDATNSFLAWNVERYGKWQHLAATWSNKQVGDGKMRLYINGVRLDEEREFDGGKKGFLATGSFEVGGMLRQFRGFKGRMDDLRMYNRALSDSEILKVYIQEGNDEINDGILLKWRMDGKNGSPAEIQDSSGTNWQGEVVGNPVFTAEWPWQSAVVKQDIDRTLAAVKINQVRCGKIIASLGEMIAKYPVETAEFQGQYADLKRRYDERKQQSYSWMLDICNEALNLEARMGFKLLLPKP